MTTPSKIEAPTLVQGETKAAHTEGPWGVREGFSAALEIYPLTGDGDAGPGTANSEIAEVDDTYDEYEANARLIAAAPDLLGACQAMLKLRHDTEMDFEEAYRAMFKRDEGWDVLEAAIAKALAP